ncbi:glycosyltransferase family 92 protein [Okeania sp.]|uniref:glycosyltransferase family 92 protein n=1 Tax=Okeania sp. TaxID=3100323 RepID=UPI002B4AAFB0|nr:glycosyltransferase family 92 protein [Okeania sp.]MEB3343449.1 glycosyltransferase family 92 protein [Okeania sp.]
MSNQSQNQKQLTEATLPAKVEVLDITVSTVDSQNLWGFYIDKPVKGEKIDSGNHKVEIMGWVLGKSSPVVAVEIICNGKILQTVPVDQQRLGVAKAFPGVKEAKNSGFSTTVRVPKQVSSRELFLRVRLKDESLIPVGKIKICSVASKSIEEVDSKTSAQTPLTLPKEITQRTLGTDSTVEIISVHVPKTAGTTFREQLIQAYGKEQVFLDYKKQPVEEVLSEIKSLNIRAIHGHFKVEKYDDYFPEAKRIIWIREPIKRLISNYWHQVTHFQNRKVLLHEVKFEKKKLIEYATRPDIKNLMFNHCGQRTLEDFWYVGITEFMEEDLVEIQTNIGWPKVKLSNLNKHKYSQSYSAFVKEVLSDSEMIEQLKAINSQDIEVYENALIMRAERIKDRLKTLQSNNHNYQQENNKLPKQFTKKPAKSKIKILDISLFEVDFQHLWGCRIARPRKEGNKIKIRGWILGKSSRVVAIEIISKGSIVQTVPIDKKRLGVAKAFPHVKEAKNSGFFTTVRVSQEVSSNELFLQARLEDKRLVPVGKIKIPSVTSKSIAIEEVDSETSAQTPLALPKEKTELAQVEIQDVGLSELDNKNYSSSNLETDSKVEIISVHLPKTAGTTFRKILEKVYTPEQVCSDYTGSKFSEELLTQIGEPNTKVIHGHFPVTKYQNMFLEAKRIIWLREPVKRLLSHYIFEINVQKKRRFTTIEKEKKKLLKFANKDYMKNLMSYYVKDLQYFWFVGIQDFFQEDLVELQQKLGWSNIEYSYANKNPSKIHKNFVKQVLADTEMIEQLRAINSQDIKIYETALKMRAERRKYLLKTLASNSHNHQQENNKLPKQFSQTTPKAKVEIKDISVSKIDSQRPIKKYSLSICGIMKNEGPYIVEWLEFHKLVGVERFYLYDNTSTDNTIDVLQPYVESGEVIYYYWPHKPGQMSAYSHCLKNHKYDSEWIAFIDLDEFLFPTVADKITDIIDEFSQVSALGVNWMNFGTSGHEKKPEGLQIENFIKCAKKSFGPNRHIKCILRPEKAVRPLNPHQFVFSQGQVVTENKQPITGPISSTHSIKKIRINHYTTRSKEESMKKMMRGRATKNEQRPWSHFESKDKIFNEVEDLTIQRFVPRLKIAVEKIQRQINKEQFLSAKPQIEINEPLVTVGNLNTVATENDLLLLGGWVVSLKYGSADSFKVSIDGTEISNFQQNVAIPSPDVQKVRRQLQGADKARFRIKIPLEQQQLEQFQDSLVVVTPIFEGNEGAALRGVLNPTIKTPKKEYIKQFGDPPNNFSHAGFKWLGHLIEIGGLQPTDHVFELGCGIGRVAYALANYLKPIAAYEGIDFRENALSFAQQEITTRKPNLNFRRENVHHPIYNPNGAVPGVEFVLPYHNFSFDVVYITDMFTHLQILEMRHYLEEVHRVLKFEGRLLFGCFLLNSESQKLIAEGQVSQKLIYEVEGGLTLDSELPEKGTGFSESLLLSLVEECGLRVVGKYYGSWCGRKSFINQDLLVLQKKTQLSLEKQTELKQISETKTNETKMLNSKLDNYEKNLEQYKSKLEKFQIEIDDLKFKTNQN